MFPPEARARGLAKMREMNEKGMVHQTGPSSPEAKAKVRLNGIQTGEYTKVLDLSFSCTACHFQDFCSDYEQGRAVSACPRFKNRLGEYVKLMKNPVTRLQVHAAKLEACFDRALEMGGKEAIFWAGMLTKALAELVRARTGEKSPGQDGEKLAEEAMFMSKVYDRLQAGEDPVTIAKEIRKAKAEGREWY